MTGDSRLTSTHLVMIGLKQAIALLTLARAIALGDDRFKTGDRTPNNHTLTSRDRTFDDRFKAGDRVPNIYTLALCDRVPNIHTLASCDRVPNIYTLTSCDRVGVVIGLKQAIAPKIFITLASCDHLGVNIHTLASCDHVPNIHTLASCDRTPNIHTLTSCDRTSFFFFNSVNNSSYCWFCNQTAKSDISEKSNSASLKSSSWLIDSA
ncbi:hypothetical protein PI95_001920 [Hassallia byssoidea VB512170]|uniref:Uncharacterized protein n=1 Tax=Hassallia byssoidea VB512170 TaxID=1304833 RepID=A0A846H486_9CYAN|nr:hypothetical protein [Hassalia byssoidea]NEU71371.1 hypothetical protein [Hassalia byssoidea VB512170]